MIISMNVFINWIFCTIKAIKALKEILLLGFQSSLLNPVQMTTLHIDAVEKSEFVVRIGIV